LLLACVLHSFLEYSYAIGRGRSSLRRCMPLPCLTHFSSIVMRTSDSTESPTGLRPPNRRRRTASQWSSVDTYLRAHSIRWTPHAQCTDRTDLSGLGLMRRGLFESVWLGPQAFMNAAAFNANIGSWNTAAMTTMSSVCAHCFTHSSSIIVCTTDSTESLSGLRPPNRRSCAASRCSSASSIAPHALGPLDASARHAPD
jgi:hypothetical protein